MNKSNYSKRETKANNTRTDSTELSVADEHRQITRVPNARLSSSADLFTLTGAYISGGSPRPSHLLSDEFRVNIIRGEYPEKPSRSFLAKTQNPTYSSSLFWF